MSDYHYYENALEENTVYYYQQDKIVKSEIQERITKLVNKYDHVLKIRYAHRFFLHTILMFEYLMHNRIPDNQTNFSFSVGVFQHQFIFKVTFMIGNDQVVDLMKTIETINTSDRDQLIRILKLDSSLVEKLVEDNEYTLAQMRSKSGTKMLYKVESIDDNYSIFSLVSYFDYEE